MAFILANFNALVVHCWVGYPLQMLPEALMVPGVLAERCDYKLVQVRYQVKLVMDLHKVSPYWPYIDTRHQVVVPLGIFGQNPQVAPCHVPALQRDLCTPQRCSVVL